MMEAPAVAEPQCIFCGTHDCEWLAALLKDGTMGWHSATLTGLPLPGAEVGLGKFMLEHDTFRRIRMSVVLEAEHSGPEVAQRMRNVARAQAQMDTAPATSTLLLP